MEISFRISFKIFLFFLLSTQFALGQNQIEYGQRESGYTIIENDTIPWVFLDDILVLEKPTFSNPDARKKYYILRHRVIKVVPFQAACERSVKLNVIFVDVLALSV